MYWQILGRLAPLFLAWLCLCCLCCFHALSDPADEKVPPPKNVSKICWIHVQKASSWIGDYIVIQHCPDILKSYEAYRLEHPNVKSFIYDLLIKRKISADCNAKLCPKRFGFHIPYNETLMKGHVVAIFRHPMSRIISAYLFRNEMMIPNGMPFDQRYPIHNARAAGIYLPIYDYVRLPGMTGCQTKLALGHKCGEGEKYADFQSRESMAMAKKTMRDFAFVGLTEYPIETEQLYRAMFGGEELKHFQPHKIKYRANKMHSSTSHETLLANLTAHKWKDEVDEQFYDEAKQVFFERCKLYRIPVSQIAVP
jgi:hypothetical protein